MSMRGEPDWDLRACRLEGEWNLESEFEQLSACHGRLTTSGGQDRHGLWLYFLRN